MLDQMVAGAIEREQQRRREQEERARAEEEARLMQGIETFKQQLCRTLGDEWLSIGQIRYSRWKNQVGLHFTYREYTYGLFHQRQNGGLAYHWLVLREAAENRLLQREVLIVKDTEQIREKVLIAIAELAGDFHAQDER